ncbi:putative bolA protein C8C9.11-like [Tropilaelaps mercedesae]|uniref:Putative bolA protein C8C9.11-like n=1 Tax=Tropilaelaps mercedesae TaxID=418985 RepID=A0A1V9XBY6_9ACAR|nr:putative bolA protein C8C9.11-like [Tropilaelaps mercedesae]
MEYALSGNRSSYPSSKHRCSPLPGVATVKMNAGVRLLFRRSALPFPRSKWHTNHLTRTIFRSPVTMGVPAAHIEAKLKEKLGCTHVELTDLSDGCGQKFSAIIVSPQFAGKNLLTQQRLVNSVLADELEQIHAFSQKTFTPEAWDKANSK